MDPVKDNINKVRETILRYGMANQGDKIIVAVSGGPDSICLLDILHLISDDLKITLVVAHYNHGLRETEDESETQLVRDFAESIKIPFVLEKCSHIKIGPPSMEEKAREARYDFLERIRKDHKAQRIAVGHNLNDQAETILMRLLRGSGPSGLAGIPPIRDNKIIRPLIEIKRKDIIAYIEARGLPYAIDSSNADTRYLRNRIRLELIPVMLKYQPRLIEQLCGLSNIIRDEDAFMESLALDWIEGEAKTDSEGHISVLLSSLKKLPAPLRNRVIRNLLKQVKGDPYPMEHDHIASVSGLLYNEQNPQAAIDLPYGIVARKVYERLQFLVRTPNHPKEYSYNLEGPDTLYVEAMGKTIRVEEIDPVAEIPKEESTSTAYLDADKLKYPLVIRNVRPGDKFIPLGMKGHKKIKDFFIDLKVPSDKRASTPILTSKDKIVWICGFRIADDFKVTSQTKKIVKVTIS